MTAHLTDHHGAIDPRAFDADRPVRPSLAYDLATDQAERRLWGSTSYVPGQGNRRMAAVGRTVEYPMHQLDVRHESRAYPGAVVWSLI